VRILYCAIDQTVPGSVGGSVHVTAVAEGLAALGHDVHVLVSPGDGPFPEGRVHWTAMTPPLGKKELRWARRGAVRKIAKAVEPDVIMERYYNFGGEGLAAAAATGALSVLEVNAPVVDYPGSPKAALDRALIVEPMRRWRDRMCAQADLIVTPAATILPPETPADRIVELEWGADTDRFTPDAKGPVPFERPPGTLALFAGAFRSWHGAIDFVRAMRLLADRKITTISAVLIGDGPEKGRAEAEASGLERVLFTGALPHDRMPACLAAADIGVAPFDLSAHKPLSLGFYWSPLKIFEYMAAGLPVVAPAGDRLSHLVGHEREGLLYQPPSPSALADALSRLASPDDRRTLGRAARERAVREYSWKAHCQALEAAIVQKLKSRAVVRGS
jgi:glycosyltransferase involved in cell wall biosynthesis